MPAFSNPKDVARLCVTFGDRSNDGKADVLVEVAAKVPIINQEIVLSFGPFNVPVEQVMTLGQQLVSALPPPAGKIGAMVIGFVKGVLH